MGRIDSFGLLVATVGAALVSCLLVLMTASEPALATAPPGENGRIAYSGWDGNDYEIYTIPPDGGSPTQLTNTTTHESLPTYSPDGSKIAYVSSDGGDDEIYSIPADGGTPTKMTDNTTDEGSPTYSPDGSKVAYTTYTAYGGRNSNEIYAMPAEGGMPTQLTDGSLLSYEPDWGVHSPDTTPPEVGSVKPADGKKGVRRGNNITATFLEKMNPDTLTDSTVFLINTRTGGVVKAQVSCDEPCQTVTINPWTRLAKNTRYKAVITKGAEDLIGHSMVQNKTWTFTTGAR